MCGAAGAVWSDIALPFATEKEWLSAHSPDHFKLWEHFLFAMPDKFLKPLSMAEAQ